MNQRFFGRLTHVFAGAVALAACSRAAEAAPKPNIVIILADDLGYGDLRSYDRASTVPTPAMDQLAASGIRFTDAHTADAVCTPSRYALLTGRYCWRTRLKSDVLDGFSPPLIEANRPTIASFLRQQGYTTVALGKWHLGMQWTRRNGTDETSDRGAVRGFRTGEDIDFGRPVRGGPTAVGFDYYFGISASLDMAPYCWIENDHCLGKPDRRMPEVEKLLVSFARGVAAEGFAADRVLPTLKARAVGWIAEHYQTEPQKPFFMYLALNSPHLSVVPSAEFLGKSGAGAYGDYVMETDDAVGAVVSTLQIFGALENTLVIVTSDNGSLFHSWLPRESDDVASYKPTDRGLYAREHGHEGNADLRGTKADIWEGGHRVPLIFSWPHTLQQGVSAVPVELTDLFATIADVCGATLPEGAGPDSFSLYPILTDLGAKRYDRPFLVHHSYEGMFSLRQQDWKYVEHRGSGGFSSPRLVTPQPGEPGGQLYDMQTDWYETKNLYLSDPERVKHFERLLVAAQASHGLRFLEPIDR